MVFEKYWITSIFVFRFKITKRSVGHALITGINDVPSCICKGSVSVTQYCLCSIAIAEE